MTLVECKSLHDDLLLHSDEGLGLHARGGGTLGSPIDPPSDGSSETEEMQGRDVPYALRSFQSSGLGLLPFAVGLVEEFGGCRRLPRTRVGSTLGALS